MVLNRCLSCNDTFPYVFNTQLDSSYLWQWKQNFSAIPPVDTKIRRLQLRGKEGVPRLPFYTLKNANNCIEKYRLKGEVRLRLVLRWCLFFGQIIDQRCLQSWCLYRVSQKKLSPQKSCCYLRFWQYFGLIFGTLSANTFVHLCAKIR